MINFVFPNLAFIESSSGWRSDSNSGDDRCLEMVIDLCIKISNPSLLDHGDGYYRCLGSDEGVLGFG